MSWTQRIKEKLLLGETVQFRPKGNSMIPLIHGGQLVTVSPVKVEELKVTDIVLCTVHGTDYLHLIKAVGNGRFQIRNNKGRINGWTRTIHGKVIEIKD